MDWSDEENRNALKTVIKWEIKHLLQRLSDVGEDTILLSANCVKGNVEEYGSNKGQGFFSSADLGYLKAAFLKYCKGKRKSSSKDYLKRRKIECSEFQSGSESHTHSGESSEDSYRKKEKRKRGATLKDEYDGDTFSETESETEARIKHRGLQSPIKLDNVSSNDKCVNEEIGNTPTVIRLPFKPESEPSKDKVINENEAASVSNISDTDYVPKMKMMVKIKPNNKKKSKHKPNSSGGLNTLKLKSKLSPKNTARKSVNSCSDQDVLEEIKVKEEFGTDLEDMIRTKTVIGSDGVMKIVQENFDEQQTGSGIASNSADINDVLMEAMAVNIPQLRHGKGFKTPSGDEDPRETALLDASKLGVGRYQCPMCFLITRDRHDLKRHLRTHTKEKPFQCPICFRKFTRKWDLENHLSKHENGSRYRNEIARLPQVANDETYYNLVVTLLEEMKHGQTGRELLDRSVVCNSGEEQNNHNEGVVSDTLPDNIAGLDNRTIKQEVDDYSDFQSLFRLEDKVAAKKNDTKINLKNETVDS